MDGMKTDLDVKDSSDAESYNKRFGERTRECLKNIAQGKKSSHLIFVGPDGSGRTTQCHEFIEFQFPTFAPLILKHVWLPLSVKKEGKQKQGEDGVLHEKKSNSSFSEIPNSVQVIQSLVHTELNVAQVMVESKKECKSQTTGPKNNKLTNIQPTVILGKVLRLSGVLQETILKRVLLNLCSSQPVSLFGTQNSHKKILVLHQAQALSKHSQQSILRLIEQNFHVLQVIFVSNQLSCFIPALQSRCQILRFEPPSLSEMVQILEKHSSSVSCAEIAKKSRGNLHLGITLSETAQQTKEKGVPVTAWMTLIREMVQLLVQERQTIAIIPTLMDKMTQALGTGQQLENIVQEITFIVIDYIRTVLCLDPVEIKPFISFNRKWFQSTCENRDSVPLELLYWYFSEFLGLVQFVINKCTDIA